MWEERKGREETKKEKESQIESKQKHPQAFQIVKITGHHQAGTIFRLTNSKSGCYSEMVGKYSSVALHIHAI